MGTKNIRYLAPESPFGPKNTKYLFTTIVKVVRNTTEKGEGIFVVQKCKVRVKTPVMFQCGIHHPQRTQQLQKLIVIPDVSVCTCNLLPGE